MNEKEFLQQLDKRLEKIVKKDDLKTIKKDLTIVKKDLSIVKTDLSIVKVDVAIMKKDWGEKINKTNKRVNDVYNLADKIAKGIKDKEQEFYARDAQVDRKLQTLAGKFGVVLENG